MITICRKCGPKSSQLFSPSQMNKKNASCRMCEREKNQRSYIRALVPAEPGYRFSDAANFGGKK